MLRPNIEKSCLSKERRMEFYTSETVGDDMNEERVIDSLFTSLNTNCNGLVKVSKLVEYLIAVAGDNTEFAGNFEDLVALLDPQGNDREIDIKEYRNGMQKWIEDIRSRNQCEEIYYTDTSYDIDRSETSLIVGDWYSMCDISNQGELRTMNMTSESVEGFGGESPLKQDWELMTKIEDLQLNNRRLVDHNAELSFQMESTEENNNQLLKEMEVLRKELRNYQTLDVKNKTIEKENEELRQTVNELQETSRNFQRKTKQLEKDRVLLNDFQEELQSKLSAAHKRLESLSNDHKNVCLAYSEEKQRLIELEELQGSKERLDEESPATQEYLTTIISDLTAQKEVLQTERNKMEAELFQVREDLNRLMAKNATTFSSSERRDYFKTIATNAAPNSLREELQEVTIDNCLPSPIIGESSSFDLLSSSYESDVFDSSVKSSTSHQSIQSTLNSSVYSPFSKSNDQYFKVVSQVAVDFREKKEKALQTISELVHMEKTRENKEMRESLQKELEKEMEFFAEKIWLLSLARKASETKISKLLALIEKLRDENQELERERDKALQRIGNLSLGSQDMEMRVEELAHELQMSVENSNKLESDCNELKVKLKKAERELQSKTLKKKSQSTSMECGDCSELLTNDDQLKRNYDELQREHDVVLATIRKMEAESERNCIDLAVEKKRALDLQESLSLSVSKHEQELQDIMETIPNEITPIKGKSSKSRTSHITGYQVQNKLKQFLSSKCLTIRDSPDGKPTNHDDGNPAGVNDGNRLVTSPPRNHNDPNISNENYRLHETPYPKNELRDTSLDSLNSGSCQSEDLNDSSALSPDIIRPFIATDDKCISPNLMEPFEKVNNETFTKSSKCSHSNIKRAETTKESLGTTSSFNNMDEISMNENNCAKNLLEDFSDINITANFDMMKNDDESAPVSSVIPVRFRKLSNITTSSSHHKERIDGSSRQTISTSAERKSSAKLYDIKNEDEKTVFQFDTPATERYLKEKDVLSCRRNGSSDNSRLTSYDGLDGYIEGVSLNSSLPSDEKELERLFKSVSLAFRTDKESLQQRLQYQERACIAAESDITKTLNTFSNYLKSLEEILTNGRTSKEDYDDILNSFHDHIDVLNDFTHRFSSQSEQYGGYQQEAKMMSGIHVLIHYGESISRRLQISEHVIAAKECEENLVDCLKEPLHYTSNKRNSIGLPSPQRSAMSSMSLTNDNIGMFNGERDTREVTCHNAKTHDGENEEGSLLPTRNDVITRTCFGRCFRFSILFFVVVVFLLIFLYLLIRYSVFDRYFILNRFHDYVNSQRFKVIYYEHEPAV